MAEKVRVGLIGSGFIADIHAHAFKHYVQNAEVIAVASPTPGKAADFARERGIPNAFGDYHELLAMSEVDMVTLALIQGVVNTFVIFLSRIIGHLVDRVVFKVERGYGPAFFITVIVAQLVLGILASIIVMWFSRQREFRADAGGAKLAGREKMVAALERLKLNHGQTQLPDQMKAFGVSGSVAGGLAYLFMSHPPLDERIQALRATERSNPGLAS